MASNRFRVELEGELGFVDLIKNLSEYNFSKKETKKKVKNY